MGWGPFDLTGKVAMVTGGGRGLGRSLALLLAEAGADVAVAELDESAGRSAACEVRERGRRGIATATDVTDASSIDAAVRRTVDELGRLDVMVNNAGVAHWSPAEAITDEQWRRIMAVNLDGVFHGCRAAGREMIRAAGGSIINIASMSATIVNVPQKQAHYNTSKAGVVQLTKSLAVEWAPHGVRVNAVSPGVIATEMTQTHLDNPDVGGIWQARTPMGRAGRPDEIAPLVVYLASDASSFMTGSDLIIDGGYTAL